MRTVFDCNPIPWFNPEEDAIDDPDETAEAIDDTLPADLWFVAGRLRLPRFTTSVTP